MRSGRQRLPNRAESKGVRVHEEGYIREKSRMLKERRVEGGDSGVNCQPEKGGAA